MDCFDADAIIYAATPGHPLGQRVAALFRRAGSGALTGAGSVLLIPEVLAKPLRDGTPDEVRTLAGLLAALSLETWNGTTWTSPDPRHMWPAPGRRDTPKAVTFVSALTKSRLSPDIVGSLPMFTDPPELLPACQLVHIRRHLGHLTPDLPRREVIGGATTGLLPY